MKFINNTRNGKCFLFNDALSVRYSLIFIIAFGLICLLQISCKKLVDVDPPVTSTNGANVYLSDATAASVLTGIYAKMSSSNYAAGGITTISLYSALSADELQLYNGIISGNNVAYYKNNLSVNTGGYEYWNVIYPYIFICNSALEGLNNSTSITFELKQQLLGEAKFMRAFFYFYLTNLYGDVPLPLTSNYKINSSLYRAPINQVYEQIIADLLDAKSLLGNLYVNGGGINNSLERIRPNKSAATALLARVYLYIKDFEKAEVEATSVINNTALYKLSTLDSTFLKNNTEAIFQLQPVNTGRNTEDAAIFVLPASGPSNSYPVFLSDTLVNSFENNDQRRTKWVGSIKVGTTTYFYPYKYKSNISNSPVIEYLTLLRLGEQYLIRAESRAQQGNVSGAQSDLNRIRNRAGLPNTTANEKSSLLSAIAQDRKIELFTEWAHRWFDLKRTNTVDIVMNSVALKKGSAWNSYQQLYPIPISDILKDPNLIQNDGY